jgi:PST family polysaccharide transporter
MTDSEAIYPLKTDLLRHRSIRGATITAASQAAKFVLMLGSQIILARLLNPADFGIVAMVAPILGFVTIMADLGLLQAVVQRPVLTRGELNAVFWINAVLSIAMAVLLMGLAPLLAWIYHEPKLIPVTLALASLVVVTGLTLVQIALLNRTMGFVVLSGAETLSLALGLGAGALAAWKGLGYWSLVISQATISVSAASIFWVASSWRPSRPAFKSESLAILRFGGNITVSNIANYLNTVLDNVLVGYNLGEAPLGLYDRAWKLAVLPMTQLLAPINRVAVPALSGLANDAERYRNAFAQMLRVLLVVALPGLAVAVMAADPMIGLLFGAKWRGVAPVFSWLCVGALVTPVNYAMFWIFVSQGRARDQMIYGTAAAIINILAYVAGVHWGLVGVARTSAISVYLLQAPLLVWAGSRSGPIDRAFFFRIIYPFILSTLGALAAIKLYDHVHGVTGFVDLAAAVAGAYAASLAILACFPSGRAAIRNVFAVGKALTSSSLGRLPPKANSA